MIRNRSHALGHANGRIQRVHAHASNKTSGIAPERDRLGRKAPHMLSPQQREIRALEQRAQQENRAGAQPTMIGSSQVTAGGQVKDKNFKEGPY
jgi:hypothetical protein